MPAFKYSVYDSTGTLRTGITEAEDEAFLKNRLLEQGFRVIQITHVGESKKFLRKPHPRIELKDRLLCWRVLSFLLDYEVPLLRALEVTAEQMTSGHHREILREVTRIVGGGGTLYKALSDFPEAFGATELSMVRAGEVAGALPDAVRRLLNYLEKG